MLSTELHESLLKAHFFLGILCFNEKNSMERALNNLIAIHKKKDKNQEISKLLCG